MKKASQRVYNMTDGELAMFASNLIVSMTRDVAAFTIKGVNVTAITAFGVLGDAFDIFPPDAYYRTDVELATESKNEHRATAEIMLRAIVGCAKIKWGTRSVQVKKFDAGKASQSSDANFLLLARLGITTATGYLSDLTSVGLTQAMIDDLSDEVQAIEDDMNAMKSAQETRDLKTQERIEKGNELYEYVVDYCEIGKIIWQDVDESKYNDYVIYPTVHHQLSKPQNLIAIIDPMNINNILLSWDAVTDATSYDVYYNIANIGSPSGTYQLLNNYAGSPIEIAKIIDKRNYYKIKAKAINNTSDYSDEAFLDVPIE